MSSLGGSDTASWNGLGSSSAASGDMLVCFSSIACRRLLFRKLERKRDGALTWTGSLSSGFFVLRSVDPSVRFGRSPVPGVKAGSGGEALEEATLSLGSVSSTAPELGG